MKERASSQRLKNQNPYSGLQNRKRATHPRKFAGLVPCVHHPSSRKSYPSQPTRRDERKGTRETDHHTTRTTHTAACVFVLSGDQKKEILADLGFVGVVVVGPFQLSERVFKSQIEVFLKVSQIANGYYCLSEPSENREANPPGAHPPPLLVSFSS